MATKSEILKKKDQWIEALQVTINKYEYTIKENGVYDSSIANCALCKLEYKDNNAIRCTECIHCSSFSSNKPCYRQKSYHGLSSTNKQMKKRIVILEKIIKRLEK